MVKLLHPLTMINAILKEKVQKFDCIPENNILLVKRVKMNLGKAETTSDHILYRNEVHYAASSGMNFFSKFDLSCKITKTIDIDLAQIDMATDLSLMGDIEEEFTLNNYAALVIHGSPEGK